MATKAYTITMPEEIMGIVDEMARREHRSRSEMLREMVRMAAARRLARQGDALGALGELFAPLREATAHMTDDEFDALVQESIREVRDAQDRPGHEHPVAGDRATKRAERTAVGPSS